MSILLNTAISALDTPTSLVPFFVKDAFDVTGRTVMANKEGGKHEAREKFIEEAGTSMFWIGGIPAVRWLAGKIAKKVGKINPDIHFKRINSNGIQNYFADGITENGKKKFADISGIDLGGAKGKLKEIKENLLKSDYIVNGKKGLYKKYHVGVTAGAVLFNLVMLMVALPKFNQFLSRKIIAKEVKQQNENSISNAPKTDEVNFSSAKAQQKTKQQSFGTSLKDFVDFKNLFNFVQTAENAQLNVTSSMLLLDYGISGSRVSFIPRNNNERVEYAIKEGGIILFFYYAADWIKKGFAALANKAFKTPIDLDYKIINDKDFLNKIINHTDKSEILNFTQIRDKEAEIKLLKTKTKDKEAIKALEKEIENFNEVNIIKMIDKELSEAQVDKALLEAKTEKELSELVKTKKNNVFKNFSLQMAQKSGLVDIEFDQAIGKWIRHSKKYIETDKVIDLQGNLTNFLEKALESGEKNMEKIIAKTKMAKGISTLGNIAICCASLSFILPSIQYKIREHRTQTKSAPGIKQYQEMAEKNLI